MKNKKIVRMLLVIIIIILLEITGIMPFITARISVTVYVALKYKDMNLKYKYTEFSSSHSNYFVAYENENKKLYNFQVGPRILPVVILFDPIDPSN